MSDKKWYESLKSEDLVGKHVHVVLSNATMDGCLDLQGRLPYWAEDDDWRYVQILEQGHDQVWRPAIGVESVSLVWDERDWEQLGPADYRKADAIVVNGRLLRVTRVMRDVFLVGECDPVQISFVSSALRCKARLPTEPGAYRGADGTLLMLTDISLPDKWMYVSEDFKECGVFLGDEQAEEHLPLTPVHFVDGRAE